MIEAPLYSGAAVYGNVQTGGPGGLGTSEGTEPPTEEAGYKRTGLLIGFRVGRGGFGKPEGDNTKQREQPLGTVKRRKTKREQNDDSRLCFSL
jgi:hypothetical protein